ncbi:MAG TPA: type II toxin-antitoxin system VapC family toxin [Ktedonobacteraceae bacterium]|nr:type II toxin-antitoxin system VapC family toxin [Ktedonobacteraceae bacterium]
MRGYVLDASAVLALLNEEPGSDIVAQFITVGAVVSTVNLSEVVSKLSERGMPEEIIHETLDSLSIIIHHFDRAVAYEAGFLRPSTKKWGLSLGDRACLALAQHLKLPAVTADKVWENLSIPVDIRVIRQNDAKAGDQPPEKEQE